MKFKSGDKVVCINTKPINFKNGKTNSVELIKEGYIYTVDNPDGGSGVMILNM